MTKHEKIGHINWDTDTIKVLISGTAFVSFFENER